MADPSTIYAENMTKVSEDYDPENTTPKTHGAMRKAAERKAKRSGKKKIHGGYFNQKSRYKDALDEAGNI